MKTTEWKNPHNTKVTWGKYFPQDIEKKWQEVWKEAGLYKFKSQIPSSKFQKYYTLVELPYPSGDLHIGHWFTFIAPDVLSRFKRMQGYNVFFPMGYDAFGLPAENAAIKRGIHPQDWTLKNIETMTAQFETMGTMIDWDHVTVTCLPEYYKWNQWIFIKMFEKGIAYRGKTLSNWCPTDQTVLANEHVENGKCWRCGSVVVQKEVEQWFLRITDYAEELLWNREGNGVDWPKSVQVAQNDWIGKSEGLEISYPIEGSEEKVTIFTSRPDTNFGATFIALAPENPLVTIITRPERKEEVEKYVKIASEKTELERKEEGKEKSGAFTGAYAINHLTGEKMPIWVSDFVLMNFGTGALVGVPAHDLRDFDFAHKFNLNIKRVVVGKDGDKSPITKREQVQEEDGIMINSDFLDGIDIHEATGKIMDYIVEKGWGKKVTMYHLHDWSVSRQRYWGTPVPMIHCDTDGIVPVPLDQLPVTLPYDVDYQPKGKPPLASNDEWMKVTCPKCGKDARRDAETLDTFFDSSWYYYRYVDPSFRDGPFDPTEVKKLMPLDIYFGGGEHTLGHTLYARFFTKFFKDLGMVNFDEFALKRVQHGIVLGTDGNKMSKSKGNVINPDDVVKEFGTDAVRVYLSFMMPYNATGPWSVSSMYGMFRFLKRVWDLYPRVTAGELTREDKFQMHTTIKKVGDDIAETKNNTAVAAMMKWLNYLDAKEQIWEEEFKNFLIILSPFAPHITEELWQLNKLSDSEAGDEAFSSIHQEKWPSHDNSLIVSDTVTVAVQINGKLRDTLVIVSEAKQSDVEEVAKQSEKVKVHLEGKTVKKVIYVPGKILNFVI
ncbi:MAG TPA: leucine--tRNA ligase [Patescibacteria group bacterium]|nr:leucine--tRNA ligase [Patescibacteria group bacterium]